MRLVSLRQPSVLPLVIRAAALLAALAVGGAAASAAGENPPGPAGQALGAAAELPVSDLDGVRAGRFNARPPAAASAGSLAVQLWDDWPQPRRGGTSNLSMSNGSTVAATVTINGIAR